MSFSLMVDVMNYAGIRGSAKLLLLVMANFTNSSTGLAWPSLSTLTEKTGLSRSQVIRLLSQLEGAGLITVERGGGRRQVNKYRVILPVKDSTTGTNGKGVCGEMAALPGNHRRKLKVAL